MTNDDEGDVMTNRRQSSGQTGGAGRWSPPIQKKNRIMMHLNDKSLRLLTHNVIQRGLDGAQWSEAERSGVETVAAVGEQRVSRV